MKNNYINETTRRRLISLMLASSLTLTSFGLTGCGKKKQESDSFEPTIKQETIEGYTKIEESWFCEVSAVNAENDMLLEGAKFELRDENNNLIDSWISSSKEVHRIENLKDGLYTLTEVTTPEGYVIAGNKNTWTINPSSGWVREEVSVKNVSASKYVNNGINNILNTGKKEDIDGQYFVLKLRESYENKLNTIDFLEYDGEIPKYILMKGSYFEIIGALANSYSVQYEFFGTEENLSSLTDSATDISFFYDNDGIYYTRIWRTDTNVVRGFITNDNLYIVPLSDLTKEELEELSLSNDINTVEKAKTRTLTR